MLKKPTDLSRWHSAAISVSKATYEYVKREPFQPNILKHWATQTLFILTHPVVVLDGELISAELTPDGDVALEEIAFSPFEFEFSTNQYERQTYRVDLVSLNAFKDYMQLLEVRVDKLFAALVKGQTGSCPT